LRRVLDNYKSVKNEQVINGVYQNLDQNVKTGIKKEKKLQFLKDLKKFIKEVELNEARDIGDEVAVYDYKYR
jgi:hypothetical protein